MPTNVKEIFKTALFDVLKRWLNLTNLKQSKKSKRLKKFQFETIIRLLGTEKVAIILRDREWIIYCYVMSILLTLDVCILIIRNGIIVY